MKFNLYFSFLFAISCADGPNDFEQVDNRFDDVVFSGFVAQPSEIIRIDARRKATSQWDAIGTAVSDSIPFTQDSSGKKWYEWSVSLNYPRNSRYWTNSAFSSRGEFRSVQDNTPLVTMTADEQGCIWNEIFTEQQSWIAAYQNCVNPTRRSVHIIAPCEGLTCTDLPVFNEVTDYPFDRSYEFANGLQGVTHDDNYWYITSSHKYGGAKLSRYAKVPKNGLQNIDSSDYYEDVFGPGHLHPGDIDYHNNWVFMALEVDLGGTASRNAIGAIKATHFKSAFNSSTHKKFLLPSNHPQETGGTFPWLARDPISGYWFSSKFNGSKLYRYSINTTSSGEPTGFAACGEIDLGVTLNRVQGGVFSESGRLYLSVDHASNANKAGVVIEMQSLFLGEDSACNANITASPDIVGNFRVNFIPGDEEIEGITIWDLDDGSIPNIDGQIHVLMIDVGEISNDDFYFKHLEVMPKNEL